MATTTTRRPQGRDAVHVQKFGTFLSNMVMPNIGAFIAWGLITALFIKTGWITLIGHELGPRRLRLRQDRRLGPPPTSPASSAR